MGNSRDENLAMGPCFEAVLCGYGVVAGGSTLKQVEEELTKLLDYHAERDMVLPVWHPKPLSWWQKWRMKRLMQRTCNPV